MHASRHYLILSIVCFSLWVCCARYLSHSAAYPFGPAQLSPLPQYMVADMGGIVTGIRRLTADVAWVQLLVYYGTYNAGSTWEENYSRTWSILSLVYNLFPHSDDHDNDHEGNAQHESSDEPGVIDSDHSVATSTVLPPQAPFPVTAEIYYHSEPRLGYPLLYNHCLRVTQLDPFFSYAYLFGSSALAWN